MPSNRDQIQGMLLKGKPAEVSRCGMSHAMFAQHRFTSEWFELSNQGQVIGSALDLDFYRQNVQQGPRIQSRQKTQESSQASVI